MILNKLKLFRISVESIWYVCDLHFCFVESVQPKIQLLAFIYLMTFILFLEGQLVPFCKSNILARNENLTGLIKFFREKKGEIT